MVVRYLMQTTRQEKLSLDMIDVDDLCGRLGEKKMASLPTRTLQKPLLLLIGALICLDRSISTRVNQKSRQEWNKVYMPSQ